MTLCVLFQLVTYLDEMFRPSAWVAVTAAFVMANESGSAVSSCLLRLVGTVLVRVFDVQRVPCNESRTYLQHTLNSRTRESIHMFVGRVTYCAVLKSANQAVQHEYRSQQDPVARQTISLKARSSRHRRRVASSLRFIRYYSHELSTSRCISTTSAFQGVTSNSNLDRPCYQFRTFVR